MNEEAFRKFLKKKGKKSEVVDRNVISVRRFITFLQKERNKELFDTTNDDIDKYVARIESEKKSAKGPLYVLMNYFRFAEKEQLLNYIRNLREERIKKTRRVFPLKGFLDIDQKHVKKLASIGIKNIEQMLESGKKKVQREQLAKQLGIPEEAILEIVKLSDLSRLGYVRTKLTRLYYNAGLDSPLKVAKFEPKELHEFFEKFVEESGWDGMVPNPSDLVYNIKNARKLSKVVEE